MASLVQETQAHAPIVESGEAAIALVRSLSSEIAAASVEADSCRQLPHSLVNTMRDMGLFGLVMPKSLGGSELGFADLVKVTVEIGSICGSAAWIYGVLAGHSWLLNLFPEQAQREIMADPKTLLGTVFRLGGEVVPEGDGYRLTGGNGRFCSGIDYATWVIIGNAVKYPDGTVEPRFFVVPKSDIEVIDDWFTMGMRGTGSRSIKIDSAFIPEHRSCKLSDMIAGTTPGSQIHGGAKYRMPFSDLSPFSIIGAPLGMAKGMVRKFADEVGGRLQGESAQGIAEQSVTFGRIAECDATIEAAIALVVADAEMIDRANAPSDINPLRRIGIPRNWAFAAQSARHAANRVFEASGGSAIYEGSAIQQMFRDINGGAQHFAFTWDTAMANFGRVACGFDPMAFVVRRKS